jgi:hypothetical protein
MIFASATLAAAGTPQSLAKALAQLRTMISGGITSTVGGATERAYQMTLQADPANTGTNIYIGGPQMVKATKVNVGLVLPKTAPPIAIGNGGAFAIDEVYFDGDTTGDKLLVSLVG